MTRRRWRAAAPALLLTLVTLFATAPGATAGTGATTPETANLAFPMVDSQTDAVLVVGQGKAAASAPVASDAIVQLTDYNDFLTFVRDPSPDLVAAVSSFFESGGVDMYLRLTADEKPTTLTAALSSIPASSSLSPGAFGLIAVPSMGQLNGHDYLAVALAADQLAKQTLAVALLDPSDQLVYQAAAGDISGLTTLASGLRAVMPSPGLAMLFSTHLVDDQEKPVAASTTVAALMQLNDLSNGYAFAAGGLAHSVDGLTPVWSPSSSDQDALMVAGIDPFVTLAGYGTVLWGDRSLDPDQLDSRYISEVRTLTHIRLAVSNWCQILVFVRNDAQTWVTIEAATTSYLRSLWQNGFLAGSSASSAYQVAVGLGSTMTAQDIANGVLKLRVFVNLLGTDGDGVTFTYQQNNMTP